MERGNAAHLEKQAEYAVYSPLAISPLIPDIRLYDGPVAEIAANIRRVVEAQGPVHLDVLMHRVATLYGLQRAGTRVQSRVDLGIRAALARGEIVRRDGFFWPAPP